MDIRITTANIDKQCKKSTAKVPINGILKHVKIISKKLGERAQKNEKSR